MTLPNRHHRPTAIFAALVLATAMTMAAMGCGTDDQSVGSGTTTEQTTIVPTTVPTTTASAPDRDRPAAGLHRPRRRRRP